MNFDSQTSLFNFPITSSDNPYDIRKIEENASKALKNINSIYNEIMSPKDQNSEIFNDYYDTRTRPVSSNCRKSQYVKTCCSTLKELCIKCEKAISRCSSCNQCKCTELNYGVHENSEYIDNAHECDNVSRYNFKMKCTIPKPFTFYEKIEEYKRTKEQKISKIKQDIDEKIEKELKIRASCKPVPKSTRLPLYNQMVKEKDKLKAERKEKCLEILNSSKPFNLHALQRSKKYKSTPDLASDNTCNFKAKPVPKHILSEKVSEKLKNREEVRKMLINERAKQTIEKSCSPFSRKNICSSSLINLTNVPKSCSKEQSKSKNISEITERLYIKKCNETMNSWNQKVLSVDTSKNNENIDFNNMFTKELVLSKNHFNKEEDLPFMYFPVRMSNAAILREKSIRSEILARKEREAQKKVEELPKKKINDDMSHKLHYLIPVSDREREIQEKVKSFRESQVRRKHEYEKELEEIMNKVSKQKLLLERQSKVIKVKEAKTTESSEETIKSNQNANESDDDTSQKSVSSSFADPASQNDETFQKSVSSKSSTADSSSKS